jgi:DnaJ-class molecular chaperone
MDVMRAYATLGVGPSASPADVRHAYRAQLQRCHPDTGAGNLRALESVTAAYHEIRSRQARTAAAQVAGSKPPVGGHVDVYA